MARPTDASSLGLGPATLPLRYGQGLGLYLVQILRLCQDSDTVRQHEPGARPSTKPKALEPRVAGVRGRERDEETAPRD